MSCGMCGRVAIREGKLTADFGQICSLCSVRYRDAQKQTDNLRDPNGEQRLAIAQQLDHATSALMQACNLAEHIDAYALEGEILTVLAALENVKSQSRRRNSARQFPADDKNG